MADQREPQPSPTPAETARQDWRALGRRRSVWPYVGVAVVSIAAGVAATLGALRVGWTPWAQTRC